MYQYHVPSSHPLVSQVHTPTPPPPSPIQTHLTSQILNFVPLMSLLQRFDSSNLPDDRAQYLATVQQHRVVLKAAPCQQEVY